MIRTVTMRLGHWSPEVALSLLKWLAAHNRRLVEAGGPVLGETAVRYRRERGEIWQDGLSALQTGHEDCDGLAAWVAGEMQADGIEAEPLLIRAPGGGWHVIVEWVDPDTGRTRIADPSVQRGMPAPDDYLAWLARRS